MKGSYRLALTLPVAIAFLAFVLDARCALLIPFSWAIMAGCAAKPGKPGSTVKHTSGSASLDAGDCDQVGCGPAQRSDAGGAPGVCNGSDHIRLAIKYDALFGNAPPYIGVLWELGAPLLYVDGHCNYWLGSWRVDDPLASWRPVRTGVLLPSEVKILEESIMYPDVRDLPCAAGAIDGSPLKVFDGTRILTCSGTLSGGQDTIWHDLAGGLYDRGVDQSGLGIRVEVGSGDFIIMGGAGRQSVFQWPLQTSIAEFVVPPEDAQSVGVSRLVTDEVSVAALLDLRDKYVADREANPNHVDGGIVLEGNYILYLRAEVPFSDDKGLPRIGPGQ